MRVMKTALAIVLLAANVSVALASPAQRSAEDRVFACAKRAAEITGLPVLLIWAVKRVESGSALTGKVVNHNDNGSVDRGLMQVNSIHESWISKFGLGADDLYDPCISLMVGAAILANEVRQHGLVEGVGRYHVGNPDARKTPEAREWARARHAWYVRRVTEEVRRLATAMQAMQRGHVQGLTASENDG